MKRFGKWYMHNWYYVGAVLFALCAFYMGFWGSSQFDRLRVILIYSMMALFCHQFEEYRIPGGAPIIINVGTYGEKKDYSHYPGNAVSIAIVNTVAWFIYAAAIIFENAIGFGLATMFFGFTQALGHGIEMNVQTKGFYNPGMATALLLHLPIGIYYIVYINQHGLVHGIDYLWGILGLIAMFLVTVIGPVQGLKDRNSKNALTDEEMDRFHMRTKLIKRGIIEQ